MDILDLMREQDGDDLAHIEDDLRSELVQYMQGQPVWWEDSRYRSGYALAPVVAVYIMRRGTKAGIAVRMRDGQWVPKIVSFSSLSTRL